MATGWHERVDAESPKSMGKSAGLWALALAVAGPVSFGLGFLATGRLEDGAYALPALAFAAHGLVRVLAED